MIKRIIKTVSRDRDTKVLLPVLAVWLIKLAKIESGPEVSKGCLVKYLLTYIRGNNYN